MRLFVFKILRFIINYLQCNKINTSYLFQNLFNEITLFIITVFSHNISCKLHRRWQIVDIANGLFFSKNKIYVKGTYAYIPRSGFPRHSL